jgi:hypothetical protein
VLQKSTYNTAVQGKLTRIQNNDLENSISCFGREDTFLQIVVLNIGQFRFERQNKLFFGPLKFLFENVSYDELVFTFFLYNIIENQFILEIKLRLVLLGNRSFRCRRSGASTYGTESVQREKSHLGRIWTPKNSLFDVTFLA